MSIVTPATLVAYFDHEDQPTDAQFANLIASLVHRIGGVHAVALAVQIDLNALAETTLYTVPGSVEFIPTHAVVRGLSAAAASAVGRIQTTISAGDIIPSIAFTSLGTDEVMRVQRDPATPYVGPLEAGEEITFEVTTAAGAARTCLVDLFGYHVEP